jgi:hypothetical protein
LWTILIRKAKSGALHWRRKTNERNTSRTNFMIYRTATFRF